MVVPRPRLTTLATSGSSVIATVRSGGAPVRVPVAVSPSLAAAVQATLVPVVAGS